MKTSLSLFRPVLLGGLAAFSLALIACSGNGTPGTPDGGKRDGLISFPDQRFTIDPDMPLWDGALPETSSRDLPVGDGKSDSPAAEGGPRTDQLIAADTSSGERCTSPGASRACTTTYPQRSACHAGTQRCVDDYWTGCTPDVMPGDLKEDCDNGVDDDCDGFDWDDPDCRTCTPNVTEDCDSQKPGVCGPGTHQCKLQEGGTWGWTQCVPKIAVGSQAEDCSGTIPSLSQDKDCDGRPAGIDGDCNPCYNAKKDANETDVDCGGSCPVKCPEGKLCKAHTDCSQGNCFLGKCGPNLCVNGKKDGDETDVDCGGSCPKNCAQGKGCKVGGDCNSGRCQGNKCVVCTTNSPTLSGNGACTGGGFGCSYRMTAISGDGNRLKITCKDSSGDCWQDKYSYVDLGTFTATGGGVCSGGFNCSYRMASISGDGNRLKITCKDSSGDCWQDKYVYIDLHGATASGNGACTGGGFGCSYRMTSISGDGNRLKITCKDSSGDCWQDKYSYVTFKGVETCK